MLSLRFDFRLKPGSASTMQEMYSAALDICQWGERNNAVTAMFSEHHSSPDGDVPPELFGDLISAFVDCGVDLSELE